MANAGVSVSRGQRLRSGLALVGGVTVVTTGYAFYKLSQLSGRQTRLPAKFVLDMDLDVAITEKGNGPWTAFAQRDSLQLSQVVAALKVAATDERVAGVVASLGANQSFSGLAQVQELRAAVLDFSSDCPVGKGAGGRVPAVAFAQSFGEFSMNGTASYYLASAFDKVYLQPSGLLALTGVTMSTAFLRPLLDKWKIRPLFKMREEYKNVANQFTQRDYTGAHREATSALLQGVMGQVVKGVAASRDLPVPEVWKAVHNAPFLPEDAVQRGLIDGVLYRDEVDAQVSDAQRVPLPQYVRAVEAAQEAERKRHKRTGGSAAVGLIFAQGNIVSGKGSTSGFGEIPQIASTRLTAALKRAREDERCKAVVLRLDTPGGSAVASDALYREVLRTVAKKPLVVSMGNVAASGGYYIAAPATKILAQEGTVTGSIGVVFGKFNLQGFLQELGVHPVTLKCGDNADAMLPFQDFAPKQEAQIDRIVDSIYDAFIEKVAQGRGMSKQEVRSVAKGRVWTGEDALARGLVDQLGGLQDAVRVAKTLAGLPVEHEGLVDLVDYSESGEKLTDIVARKLREASSGVSTLVSLGMALEAALPPGAALRGFLEGVSRSEGGVGLKAEGSEVDWS